MTKKQQQCLLCYLGYDVGAIDGIWGSRSRAAAMAFQTDHGLTPDGILDALGQAQLLSALTAPEPDWWSQIRWFTLPEFACKCGRYCDGYPAQPSRTLVELADRVRQHFGVPVVVSSGLRCKTHNANVGGLANSRHLSGRAMDFCVTGRTAAEVLSYVRQQPEVHYAYAIDGQYVHMDVA